MNFLLDVAQNCHVGFAIVGVVHVVVERHHSFPRIKDVVVDGRLAAALLVKASATLISSVRSVSKEIFVTIHNCNQTTRRIKQSFHLQFIVVLSHKVSVQLLDIVLPAKGSSDVSGTLANV